MKAAFITRFGPPEVLQIQEIPIPTPKDNEVLVKVKAIGLNFADVMARLGIYPSIPDPPFVPGIEFSGTVRSVGNNVRGIKKGERVWAFSKQGAYAEYVAVPADSIVPVPPKMSLEIAAATGVTYLTAYHGLVTLANIKQKEKLLLHAAAGGVGIAAIQIAKHLGVEVFATASNREKLELARTQGAHHTINYSEDDFEEIVRKTTDGYGVDVVMDSVGGRVMKKSWKLLAPMGRYVLYGFASVTGKTRLKRLKMLQEGLAVPFLYPPTLVSKNVGFFGFNLYFLTDRRKYLKSAISKILTWYEKGIIHPYIGARYSFDQIAEAQAFLQSRQSVGKVVVTL